MEIASFIDSTNLRPEASAKDIGILCREAVQYDMAAVCVNPGRLLLAKGLLAGSQVKLCTVIGFPLGADGMESKVFAAAQALACGADELDMVINIGAVKDHDYAAVIREIETVRELKKQRDFVLKVIVETALLTAAELAKLTKCVGQAGADYIKTSTGFASRGVSLEDIEIIKGCKEEGLKIKASGGIKELDFALELLRAGADRLGTSQARSLIEEHRHRSNQ